MNCSVEFFVFVFCSAFFVLSVGGFSGNMPMLMFEDAYSHLFGGGNLIVPKDGKSAHITLDERTGSGFVSQDVYLHGYFSASIKLPPDYTAGVVVAFYLSNGDTHTKNHDEIDFEFLGNIRGRDWRVQTNIYGNGSTSVGREERYDLWFDPSEDFHQYTILWTADLIVFYIDHIPIRKIERTTAMGGDFPSKPMSLYATIWDGSNWATNGGKFKVLYKYAPYIAEFSDFVLHGCAVDPIGDGKCEDAHHFSSMAADITQEQQTKMSRFRNMYMQYSYCYDRARYKVSPVECVIDPNEAEQLRDYDPVTFGGALHRNRGKRRRLYTPGASFF